MGKLFRIWNLEFGDHAETQTRRGEWDCFTEGNEGNKDVSLNIPGALAGGIVGAAPEAFAGVGAAPGGSFDHGFGTEGTGGGLG